MAQSSTGHPRTGHEPSGAVSDIRKKDPVPADRLQGKIIRGVGGFYYVKVTGSAVYACRAKGIFRKEGIKPLVGDDVEIEITHEKDMEGNVVHILPRENALIRPAAANIDQALIILALDDPKPNESILDRFLIRMEKQDLACVICFNKNDLSEEAENWADVYSSAGYEVHCCSVKTGEGLASIREAISGKTTVVAGPSGVGKSSLINILAPHANMETGETSKKLGRGRHTTRHCELFEAGDDTFILDTPGFTSLELEDIESGELSHFYPEFRPFEDRCRFTGCVHINEPDCAVKEALKNGVIRKGRYDSYVQIFGELKSAERHKY